MMDSLELRPGRIHALASGIAETVGGVLLTARELSPLGAALTHASMFTAIRKVHLQKGVWNQAGGFEYNLVLIAAATALVDDDHGPAWALAALGAGAAGSAIAIEADRQFEPEPEPTGRFVREPVAEEVLAGTSA
jgi:putative oxidoreductase